MMKIPTPPRSPKQTLPCDDYNVKSRLEVSLKYHGGMEREVNALSYKQSKPLKRDLLFERFTCVQHLLGT